MELLEDLFAVLVIAYDESLVHVRWGRCWVIDRWWEQNLLFAAAVQQTPWSLDKAHKSVKADFHQHTFCRAGARDFLKKRPDRFWGPCSLLPN